MEDWAKKRLAELQAAAPKKSKADKKKRFAYVPLPWGYRVFAVAGAGAPIVIYALHKQALPGGHNGVKITAAVLKNQCGGLDRKTRSQTLDRLVAAGLASVRRSGRKFRGCPILLLHISEQ